MSQFEILLENYAAALRRDLDTNTDESGTAADRQRQAVLDYAAFIETQLDRLALELNLLKQRHRRRSMWHRFLARLRRR